MYFHFFARDFEAIRKRWCGLIFKRLKKRATRGQRAYVVRILTVASCTYARLRFALRYLYRCCDNYARATIISAAKRGRYESMFDLILREKNAQKIVQLG